MNLRKGMLLFIGLFLFIVPSLFFILHTLMFAVESSGNFNVWPLLFLEYAIWALLLRFSIWIISKAASKSPPRPLQFTLAGALMFTLFVATALLALRTVMLSAHRVSLHELFVSPEFLICSILGVVLLCRFFEWWPHCPRKLT